MKNILIKLTMLFILINTFSYAQSQTLTCDKIVCINGEEIEALISEITPDIISYKKCDNADGPKYSIERTKVFVIKYKNGTKEVINDLNNPIGKTIALKKIKKAHRKLYLGIEVHYDQSLKRNFELNTFDIYRVIKGSYNTYPTFLFNYKLNNFLELDGVLGVGIGEFKYEKYTSDFIGLMKMYPISITENYNKNEYIGVIGFGLRLNYFNLFKNKERFLTPFIKPEISIMTATKNPILSYSAMFGLNLNKFLSFSIGYKYLPMKTISMEYSNNYQNSKIIGYSTIGFHNILGKISFEF